jgi:hypothetical protein
LAGGACGVRFAADADQGINCGFRASYIVNREYRTRCCELRILTEEEIDLIVDYIHTL